jgi:hypothetical protein
MVKVDVSSGVMRPLVPAATRNSALMEQLQQADFVYIKAPPTAPSLAPAYRGQYVVHKRAKNFFIIKLGSATRRLIWID